MHVFSPLLSFDQILELRLPDVKLRFGAMLVGAVASGIAAILFMVDGLGVSFGAPIDKTQIVAAVGFMLLAAYFSAMAYYTDTMQVQVRARIDPVFRDFCWYKLTSSQSTEASEVTPSELLGFHHKLELDVENLKPLERDILDECVMEFRDRQHRQIGSPTRPPLRVVK